MCIPLTMCSKCETIQLGMKIPHQVSACPLLRASYCSLCCCKGHFTEDCPDEEVSNARQPQYVEQLIPYSVIEQYKITTLTEIPAPLEKKKAKYLPVLEVEKTPKAIRQILMNYDIQPSGKEKELPKQLMRLAEQLNRKLEFITPIVDEATKQNNTKKKTSSSKKQDTVS